MPRYILVHSTASTNSYLSRMAALLPSGTVIHTPDQTNGRGQRGNTWESEPGKNIIFSYLVKSPAVAPAKQFFICEAASLAIVETLNTYINGFSVKWPNDIYFGDKKISGTLIEHSITSSAISHSIIGVGININQTTFLSDAPNPVSLMQIINKETDIDSLLHQLCANVEKSVDFSSTTDDGFKVLHQKYLDNLYRNDGMFHKFMTPDNVVFDAQIETVMQDGTLVLKDVDGTKRNFSFKEVSFVIS